MMDDKPLISLDTVPPKRTLVSWVGDLSRTRWAFVFVGLALFAWGAVPIAAALVVANRAIDDGPDRGDDQLKEEWDWWAFSPRFAGFALCGAGIVAAALLRKKTGWQALAIMFILLTAFLTYDAQERRKLIPPRDLTLDTFFDWQPETKWAVVTTTQGSEHITLIGPLSGGLPSGPSAYVFDKSGKLVDWVSDSGDAAEFQERWLSRPWKQVDRKSTKEWKAAPLATGAREVNPYRNRV